MARMDSYPLAIPTPGDHVLFVDVSDTSEDPSGTTKRADIVNLVGPQGEQGPQGDPGIQGIQGPTGNPGSDGAPGADGNDGAPGADGNDGAPGLNGVDGAPGADGVAVRGVIIEPGVARTLVEAESANHIVFTADTAITVTAPQMAAGRYFYLRLKGSGPLTVVGASGVTLEVDPGAVAQPRAQGSMLTVLYESATEIFVTGDLAEA